eukprot:CAMPEP_0172696738 /NCGR_PEP_ID=MMETSP1074-20121228/28261_1 /TAXON_ID=2916 /ORGANISM="Ceratium fusus, Strain PA161109" /LENGTH=57 /DNA_ID=CAMNT_0013517521 /DNA_START=26 /DNA_END=196 /DNA_ORIENTATION=-
MGESIHGEAVLAWFDGILIAQRHSIESVLQSQHQELVRELGMRIKAQRPLQLPQLPD